MREVGGAVGLWAFSGRVSGTAGNDETVVRSTDAPSSLPGELSGLVRRLCWRWTRHRSSPTCPICDLVVLSKTF